MRDVAHAAGVAVETVYALFGSKVALLRAALDVAVVGDTALVALRDRPAFAALGQGSMTERARAAASLVGGINERLHGLGQALREGAPGDVELAQHLSDAEARRRTDVAHGGRLIAGRRISETERDGLWAVLSVEVYELLVGRAGWSIARYEKWITEAILRLLNPVEVLQ
jgi:AcrR family transcriptional regulator